MKKKFLRNLSIVFVLALVISLSGFSTQVSAQIKYSTVVSLSPGQTFSSYQYELRNRAYVAAMVSPHTPGSVFSITLYGCDTIGGKRTLIGTYNQAYIGNDLEATPVVDNGNNFRYYNIVVKNIGNITSNATTGIYYD